MDIKLEPGKYVVAVSGGVDSVVLLDLLCGLPNVDLVVAHFDHGMRSDSTQDKWFAESLTRNYDVPFECAEGRLGAGASEAAARQARYDFLKKIQHKYGAHAIITAHHQDDVLETAIINLLRGTGRKGLSALGDRPGLKRPLLKVPKKDLIAYAHRHGLEWREDSTNTDRTYLRNYIRHNLVPRFDEQNRQAFLKLLEQARDNNNELDIFLGQQISGQLIDKLWFNQLPHQVSLEVMAAWLRQHDIRDFDRRTLERLVVAAKTGPTDRQFDVAGGAIMKAQHDSLALVVAER
ncbi:MAG TPA: tRNA lysidine(34) synthetase TilS [Candidatus Saccharimonadales bacterium]|nr:tRNA lysidine(34) synthetase TilS [Candidatus Saccharimonadales bacterium]